MFRNIPARFSRRAQRNIGSHRAEQKSVLKLNRMKHLLYLAIALQAAPPEAIFLRVIVDRDALSLDSLTLRQFETLLLEPALHRFYQAGIRLPTLAGEGGIRLGQDCLVEMRGMDPCRVNVILTDRLPTCWGAGLPAVSLLRGRAVVVVIGVLDAGSSHNTVPHQLLHALMGHPYRQRFGIGAIWNELAVEAMAGALRLGLPMPWNWIFHRRPCE